MRKILFIIILVLLSKTLYGFNSYKYLDLINPTSEGFLHSFVMFNSYPFSVFSSPQSFKPIGNYSLGFSVNGSVESPILSIAGHFKLFDYPILLGLSSLSSSSEAYNNGFGFLGNYNQNFLLFGVGTKFDKVLSSSFGDIDIGSSILFSIDIWSFPQGMYAQDNYYLESFGIPVFGIKLSTPINLDFSLSQKFFIGGFFGDISFGTDTKVGVRYYPLSLFSEDNRIYKYFVVYPYFGIGYIQTFPTNDYFVNSFFDYRYGIGITSEPVEGLKLSFGLDNKGFSLSFVFTFFSSPIGIGNQSYEGISYNLVPSLYLILTEGTVKEIIGITPDKEEVEKGIVEYEKGNFTNANYHFEKALKFNPSNQVAQIYIQKLKLWLESDELLTKEQQEYVKTLLTRAKVLRSQNKYGDALKEYKKVLEINPYNKEANDGIKEIENIVSTEVNNNYSTALGLYSKNELMEAKKVITKNFELNPFHEPSIKLAKEIDDRIASETTKKLELEQRKTLSYSLYSQGMQEFSSYNFSKALELFNKALEIYPDNKEAEEAIKRTLKEIEISSTIQQNKAKSDSLLAEGIKLRNDGKYWDAINKFREAIMFFKDNENAKTEMSNTIDTIKKQAFSFEKEGDDLFVNGDISKAFERWDNALTMLRDLPEAVALKQKISLKKEELKSSIDIKIANAQDLLNSSKFVEAMKIIEGVLKLDPTNKQATQIYSTAKRRFDEYVNKKLDEGIGQFNNKNYSSSITIFEELISIVNPNDSRYARVKKYYDESKSKFSEIEVSKKIEEKIKEADAFLANYDYDGAKKILGEALKLDPNNVELKKKIEEIDKKSKEIAIRDEANRLLSYGLREIRKKNYIEGIDNLKKAREKFIALGDDISFVDEYIKTAEEEFTLEKDRSFKDGKSAYEKGDYIKAREYLEIALKNNPNSSEVKTLLTEVNNKLRIVEKEILEKADGMYSKGEYDNALEQYNTLLKISPNNEIYEIKVDNIQKIKDGMTEIDNLMNLGKYSEALDVVDKLKTLNPEDKNLDTIRDKIMENLYKQISSLRVQADELIKSGDYAKAVRRLETILKFDPNDVDAKSKLQIAKSKLEEKISKLMSDGRNAYNSGKYSEAIRLFSLVLEDDPNNQVAKSLLSDARKKYNETVAKDKEKIERDVATFISRGVEEYRKGNIDKAIDYWQKVLEIDPENEQARKYIARAKLGK